MKTIFLSLPMSLLIFLSIMILPAQAQIPAFPDCEGFGCDTPGGRGGKVVFVTNLNDAGPGSLREALMMTEPRIVVFKVSGTIHLNSHLRLGTDNSYVTVVGQTAPGDGIAIADYELRISDSKAAGGYGFHDGVFQHLRFRSTAERPVILYTGTHHVVFDHISITWSNDGNITTWGDNISDITFQWNVNGEAGSPGPRQKNAGGHLSGGCGHERITFHHNYLAHTVFRNYLIDTGEYSFINNVNYNTENWDFEFQIGYQPCDISPDFISQYFKEGPDSRRRPNFDLIGAGPHDFSIYLEGNKYVDINENLITDDQKSMVETRDLNGETKNYDLNKRGPHSEPKFPITMQSADAGKDLVLAQAGPRPLDAVDARLLRHFSNGGGYDSGNIGQFPDLQTYNVPTDSDNDGMPDDWEVAHGLNPNDASDNTKDRDDDGYTNIEEWINSIGGEELPPPPPDSRAPSPPQNVKVKVTGS